jgi:hypothetical protein
MSEDVHAASLIALVMEATQTSEALVNSNQSVGHYTPEDCHHQFHFCGYIPDLK